MAAISHPFPCLVCCALWLSCTGSLTATARAFCWELEYVGLSLAPFSSPLLSC